MERSGISGSEVSFKTRVNLGGFRIRGAAFCPPLLSCGMRNRSANHDEKTAIIGYTLKDVGQIRATSGILPKTANPAKPAPSFSVEQFLSRLHVVSPVTVYGVWQGVAGYSLRTWLQGCFETRHTVVFFCLKHLLVAGHRHNAELEVFSLQPEVRGPGGIHVPFKICIRHERKLIISCK